MINHIYESKVFNPYYNIAFEKDLADKNHDSTTLFLWQNDNTVVIGRNQNPYVECDLDYLKKNQISLARRFSGGGAVFHDLGNINYTLIIQKKAFNLEKIKSFLLKMGEIINLNIKFSGKNDMTIDGAKFSGHAYFVTDTAYIFHGTIMVDLDILKLSKCLTPSIKKLESKGIKSVKSRVVNLKQLNPSINIEKIKSAFKTAFKIIYGESTKTVYLGEKNVNKPLVDYLKSSKWLFEETPKFSVSFEKRFPFGNVTVNLNIKDNKIENVKIFSDSLKMSWTEVETSLLNMSLDEAQIWEIISQANN